MKKEFNTRRKVFLISLIVILIIGVLLIICGVVKNYSKPQGTQNDVNFPSGEAKKDDMLQFGESEKLGFKVNSENEENNNEIKDELNIEELKLSNFQVSKADESILISGKIENTSSKAINNIELRFILYKNSSEGMYEYTMKIPETLEANEKRDVETCIGYRYEDIASLDVKLEKLEFAK